MTFWSRSESRGNSVEMPISPINNGLGRAVRASLTCCEAHGRMWLSQLRAAASVACLPRHGPRPRIRGAREPHVDLSLQALNGTGHYEAAKPHQFLPFQERALVARRCDREGSFGVWGRNCFCAKEIVARPRFLRRRAKAGFGVALGSVSCARNDERPDPFRISPRNVGKGWGGKLNQGKRLLCGKTNDKITVCPLAVLISRISGLLGIRSSRPRICSIARLEGIMYPHGGKTVAGYNARRPVYSPGLSQLGPASPIYSDVGRHIPSSLRAAYL